MGPAPKNWAEPQRHSRRSREPGDLTDEEMAHIATLDTGITLFFDHRDPAMVSTIGNRPIHD